MNVPTTAWETAAAVRAKELTALEALEAALKRIENANPALNAFIYLDPDAAMKAAKHVDESKAGQHCKKIDYASLEQERFFLET